MALVPCFPSPITAPSRSRLCYRAARVGKRSRHFRDTRLVLAAIPLLLPWLAPAQSQAGQPFQEAGVCGRCHVVSVVEWGLSGHRRAGTNCTSCHGASQGHVVDERNNVKPDRIPRNAAIAGLCGTCHRAGCPKTQQANDCQRCHHVHALSNPNAPPSKDDNLERLAAAWQEAGRHTAEGERLLKLQQWEKSRAEFRLALRQKPGDSRALRGLRVCGHRLNPVLQGFETVGSAWDPQTGLAREVRVAGTGIPMMLVPGGEFEMGSDRFPGTQPVHTVRIEPFYLGKYELTQAEWKALMGSNPSARAGERLPVEQVSWDDAQALVRNLNERVPGGGFRLPSEAEWEFAARFGEPPAAVRVPREGPEAAGSGQPTKLGLFNMQGNVWEWCSSLYAPYPYDAGDGRESLSAPGLRVLRGGGFADPPELLDPGFRHAERPTRRLRWNGIRIARSAPDVQ